MFEIENSNSIPILKSKPTSFAYPWHKRHISSGLLHIGNPWPTSLPHWKKYFNVHFKSQNYSCLLDSHPCLGYRNFCCKKISCNKSKIKAVVLMEKLKQHNSGVKFTPAYFFPCHFDSENKLHWQYSLSIRQYSLSIRQRILLM